MKKIVVKFGGSSLADAGQFQKAKGIIIEKKERRYVVVSAPGKRFTEDIKVTDMLYRCYETAVREKSFQAELQEIRLRYEEIIEGLGLSMSLEKEFEEIQSKFEQKAGKDYAASRGEYLNGKIMAEYLGFPFLDAAEVIRFDADGVFLSEETQRIFSSRIKEFEYAVIPGFYGADSNGVIHTFSRGGSDITGSIAARAAQVDLYENWTDVSGFLVADPRIIDNPQVISMITYRELRELSYMGAGVLHEDAIFPVRQAKIPINIRNTNEPQNPGTMIVANTCVDSRFTITGIAGKRGFAAVTIEKDMMNGEIGFGRKVLGVFQRNQISFEHMPSGIDTMTVFVQEDSFCLMEDAVLQELQEVTQADSIEVDKNLCLIAVVGRGMKTQRGTAGRIFSALAHSNVNVRMIDQGSSQLNIIIGVEQNEFEKAIRSLYDIFVTAVL